MTKLDAGLITPLPASDPGSAAVWGSKRINPRPQFCLCLAWGGCPSNDDDEHTFDECPSFQWTLIKHHQLHATQLKPVTQTHPLHDLNAYSDSPRNIKATIFQNNNHTIIISKLDSTPKECQEDLEHHLTIAQF